MRTTPRVVLSCILFLISPVLASAQGWYNNAWSYRKAITISNNQNSGGTALTNFPVLISVTDANLAASAQSTGNDILFTASDGVTKLSHEIETYTSSGGVLKAWVSVSISPVANTVIYMYYGNASAPSQQNPTGAWDSNYMGVWHLPNGTTLSANDSTGHANNGSISGAGAVAGEIAGAASFNGASSSISIGDASSVQITGQITMSAWVNVPAFPPPDTNGNCCWSYVIGKGYDGANEGFFLRLNDQNGPMLLEAGSYQYPTNNTVGWTISGWNTNSWHYVTGTYDGSAWHVYLDGVLEDSSTQTTGAVASGAGVYLGGASINGSLGRYWDGNLDEVRLSNIARSGAWIAAEFHNQSSPSTFFSIGSQETSSSGSLGGTSVSPASGSGMSQTFTATYNDPAGASDIQNLVINIGNSPSAANSCSVLFAQATSQFQLSTNGGSWGSLISPGSSASNSQCTLNTASSSYSFNGNTGTITVNFTFTPAFAGTQGIWLYVSTYSGSNASSSQLGSWTVTAAEGVTVTSSPPGLTLSVDGSNCTAPCSESWTAGSSHTIAVATSPQAGSSGTQYIYSSWSDGGAQTHSITVPSSPTTYTASFSTQYYLTTAASPPNGGSITPSSGWYNSGTSVSVSAAANSGYAFSGFSGALSGAGTPQILTMNAPESVTATFGSATGPSWYNGAWMYRKSITVASGQVSGSANLTNFPMLFSVSDSNLASAALANGYDILFTASDGVTKLNHEIEGYSSGQLTAWVQVPTLSYSANTVLYMYYGNASSPNQQNPAGSWDSNFVGVYHFPNGTTLTANDSTSNGNNGTITNGSAAAGIAGGGASFNGTSTMIDMGTSSTFDAGTLTYEAWIKPSPISGPSNTLISQGTQGPTFRLKTSGNIYSSDECVVDNNVSTGTVSFNAWNFVAMTWNSSTGAYEYFINGQPSGDGSTPENFVWTSFRVGTAHCYPEFFGGMMDEIRMSNTIRSPGWIATEYANMNSPASFYSVGGQQTSSGGGSPPIITTGSPLPSGNSNYAYGYTLAATGGTPPYAWSIASGSLPSPLTLSSTSGLISGVRPAVGDYYFTVLVRDSAGLSATQTYALSITSLSLTITTAAALPNATVGVPYTLNLAAIGGVQPYFWFAQTLLPTWLNLNSAGMLSGTPTAPTPTGGYDSLEIQVNDATGGTSRLGFFTLAINPATGGGPTVTCSASPNPTAPGQTVTFSAVGSNGSTPYTFSWSGIVAASSGSSVTFQPSSTGTYNEIVNITDSLGRSNFSGCSVVISQTLTVTTNPTLPSGVEGAAYSPVTLAATGGSGGYTWAASPGAIPPGLVLSASGVISGTPSVTGPWTFTVKVTDSSGHSATSPTLSLSVLQGLTITTTSLPGGSTGVAYSQTVAASGGITPYTWNVYTGSLPPGITLNASSGGLSGTPTSTGTFTFVIQVTDSAHNPAFSPTFTVNIGTGLTINTSSLSNGVTGVAYSQSLAASGGTTPYTWTLSTGTLPAGITLNSSTGLLSGTPTTVGSSSFVVQVSDSASHTATSNFTLTVTAPTLSVTCSASPNPGSTGVLVTFTATPSGGVPNYSYLWSGGTVSGTNPTATFIPSSATTYTANIQVTDSQNSTASGTCSVTVPAVSTTKEYIRLGDRIIAIEIH